MIVPSSTWGSKASEKYRNIVHSFGSDVLNEKNVLASIGKKFMNITLLGFVESVYLIDE